MFSYFVTYTGQEASHGILITLTDGCQSEGRISRPIALVSVAKAVTQIQKLHYDGLSLNILFRSKCWEFLMHVFNFKVKEYIENKNFISS